MKGIPSFIQTPEDMTNLFEHAKRDEISKPALAEKIRALLEMQFHNVPVLSQDGENVTVRYCPEINVDDVTGDGLTVTAVEHVEAPPVDGDETSGGMGGEGYAETVISLSAPLAEGAPLRVYKPDNYLTQRGFDVQQMNYILEVLA